MARHCTGILATGSYLPEREVTNPAVVAMLVAEPGWVTPEWIERKTHIRARRYAAPAQATSDLAVQAATRALDRAGLPADALDFLIVATSTGDHPQPPTSYLVQHGLGAASAACLDINVVCSGFVYGLALAHSLTALRPGTHALVVGADVYSRILDFADHRTAILLGDGAGAAVLGPVPPPYGVLDFELASRGDAHRLIGVSAGGSRTPTSHATVAAGGHLFTMDGRGVRDFVLAHVPPALAALARRAGVPLADVDHFVPHQANGVLLGDLVQRAGMDRAQVHRTLDRYGNVGSASVPVALDEANRTGALRDGDLVLLSGFGGGMSIGNCLLRWRAAS